MMKEIDQLVKPIADARTKKAQWTDSEWGQIWKIYCKLWPVKGATPEALDWWSMSTAELTQAEAWTDIFSVQ